MTINSASLLQQFQQQAQQQLLQQQNQGRAAYLADEQLVSLLSTAGGGGSSNVSLNSGGGKQALDYLERNGPVTQGQVKSFKAATHKEVSDAIVNNRNVGNGTINGNPHYISDNKFDLLSLFNKILDNNFNEIAAQDGQAGLSAADLRGFLS